MLRPLQAMNCRPESGRSPATEFTGSHAGRAGTIAVNGKAIAVQDAHLARWDGTNRA